MPEGDTVFIAARTLDHALAGRVVRSSDFRVPRLATARIDGQTVLEVKPRGKHMLLRTDGGFTLQTHFMMDGAWYLYKPGARWSGGPSHDIRVVIETDDWIAVGYRLAIVELYPTVDEARRLEGLGPDILGPDWDEAEAVRRLLLRPERAIGEALLDQTCLAGIGNIYRSESLFARRVHPLAAVGAVADVAAVVRRAREFMEHSVRTGRQSTTGIPRDPFYVFERAGKPCRVCRTRIESSRAERDERVTNRDIERARRIMYWCPRCQPPL